MYKGKKVIVVLPPTTWPLTLERPEEIPFELVDEVILCDDASSDNTGGWYQKIGITQIIIHENNKGYGGNQIALQQSWSWAEISSSCCTPIISTPSDPVYDPTSSANITPWCWGPASLVLRPGKRHARYSTSPTGC